MIENIDNEKVIIMKRMKWLAPIVCAAILAVPGTASAESTDVELIVGHAHVSGSAAEGEVYINDAGRTMIPLRIVSSAMGYTTVWQPDGSIRITSPDGTVDVSLAVGKLDYTAGGQSGRFETAPMLRHDRTYLPARDFSELYGSIYWDGDTRTVWIAQGAGVSYQVIGDKLLRADEAGARVLALPDGLRLRSGSLLIDREAGGARYVAVQCDGGHAKPLQLFRDENGALGYLTDIYASAFWVEGDRVYYTNGMGASGWIDPSAQNRLYETTLGGATRTYTLDFAVNTCDLRVVDGVLIARGMDGSERVVDLRTLVPTL